MSVNHILRTLHEVFIEHSHSLARSSGFCQRQSRLSAQAWVQGLVFGWLSNPQASVSSLVRTLAVAGAPISPQALQQRFSPAGAALLRGVLEAVTVQTLATGIQRDSPASAYQWLRAFPAVWLRDSTLISLPLAVREQWPGSGGQHGPSAALSAALKVSVQWEWHSGTLLPLHLTPATQHDHKAASEQQRRARAQGHEPCAGEMHVFDLGYFCLEWLAQLHAQGAYFCCRYKGATQVQPLDCEFLQPNSTAGEWAPLVHWLEGVPTTQTHVEWAVKLGRSAQLPVRLIAVRVPDEVAVQRRQACLYYNGRRQRNVSPERLALCSWNVYVTNAPATLVSGEQVGVLYRVRWQIERLFRLWKETLQVDHWRTKNPQRILCEVYAKLIGALLTQQLTVFCAWYVPARSLVKCAHTIAAHALALLIHLHDKRALTTTLLALRRACSKAAKVESRRTRPATFQRINHVQTPLA